MTRFDISTIWSDEDHNNVEQEGHGDVKRPH
jgi:hypothetical protein